MRAEYDSPEKEMAGFGIRFFADLFDSLILTAPVMIGIALVTGDWGRQEWTQSYTWSIAYALYCTFLPLYWNGYIIGKRLFKIRVVRFDGERLDLKTMILRELVGKYLLGFVTFGLSMIVSAFMIGLRRDKRGIHDYIGGTYVSKE